MSSERQLLQEVSAIVPLTVQANLPMPLEQQPMNYGRLMTAMSSSVLLSGMAHSIARAENEAWLFRDDIGAPNGIKGYEEQICTVGLFHHGHNNWTSEWDWNTFNSQT